MGRLTRLKNEAETEMNNKAVLYNEGVTKEPKTKDARKEPRAKERAGDSATVVP